VQRLSFLAYRPIMVLLVILMGLVTTDVLASSAVHYVTLDRALSRTDAAVLVTYAKPKLREVRIPITPRGQKANPAKWPDFVRRDYRFKTLKVIWLRSGKKPAKTLTVAPGNWQRRLIVHRKYHVEGVRKIPIYTRFDGYKALEALEAKNGKAIVLLRRNKTTGWQVSVESAFLLAKKKKTLLKALKRKP
jgi:hypothetical protein